MEVDDLKNVNDPIHADKIMPVYENTKSDWGSGGGQVFSQAEYSFNPLFYAPLFSPKEVCEYHGVLVTDKKTLQKNIYIGLKNKKNIIIPIYGVQDLLGFSKLQAEDNQTLKKYLRSHGIEVLSAKSFLSPICQFKPIFDKAIVTQSNTINSFFGFQMDLVTRKDIYGNIKNPEGLSISCNQKNTKIHLKSTISTSYSMGQAWPEWNLNIEKDQYSFEFKLGHCWTRGPVKKIYGSLFSVGEKKEEEEVFLQMINMKHWRLVLNHWRPECLKDLDHPMAFDGPIKPMIFNYYLQ
ncbi:MAG: hypothetical protein ACOYOK_14425 [Pseudobdellovibrionaceae bacterium]